MKMFTKFFAAIAVILALGAASAQAATYNVTNNNDLGPGSLRQAIIDANANVGVADLILIDGPVSGTITTLASDLPDITESCTISCPNATFTVDGNNDQYRVFRVSAGGAANVVINGIRIRNAGTGDGPGLYITNGSVTVTNCIFSSCVGGNGGGVYQAGGSSTFLNCYIINNTVSDYGGGCCINGGLTTFYRCVIKKNSASNHSGYGGGIYTDGTSLDMRQCSVDNNTAKSAAGIYAGAGISGTISRSTISNNAASKLSGNDPGGIFFNVGTFHVINTTISNNTTNASGGGVGIAAATNLFFTYCTITDNWTDYNNGGAGDGGGLYQDAGTVHMQNTLLAGNYDNSGGQTANDVWIHGGTFNDNGGSVTGELPYLNALAYVNGGNGNITKSRSIQECSSAIDQAVPASDGHPNITEDQNGVARGANPNTGACQTVQGACPSPDTDGDGDGIPDYHESDAPNFGDANSDGVIDSQEGYVCTFMNDAGTGYLIIESSTLTDGSDSYTVYKPFNTHFSGMEATMFPVGLTGARLEGAPDFSKIIRYWFYTDFDPNLIAGYKWYIKTAPDYAKYEWHEVPPDNGDYGYIANSLTYGTTDGQNWIRFDVRYTDNMFGDSNPIAGILDDPIAPYTAMTSIPALGEWGGYALGGVLTLAGAFIILRRKFL